MERCKSLTGQHDASCSQQNIFFMGTPIHILVVQYIVAHRL